MKRPARRWPAFLSALVIVAVAVSACSFPATDAGVDHPQVVAAPPSASQLDAFTATLPTDPIAATEAIVAAIFGTDPVTAVSATVAALIRSGIAVTDDDAQVVAASDRVYADYLVPLAYVPSLTNALRDGEFYTSDDVSAFFEGIGITDEPVSTESLATTLRDWGKDATDPSQVKAGGDLVRALAAHDHSLPVSGSSPRFDPLQFLLLFVQLTGSLYDYDATRTRVSGAGTDDIVAQPASFDQVAAASQSAGATCLAQVTKREKTSEKIRSQLKGIATGKILDKAKEWAVDNLASEGAEQLILKHTLEDLGALIDHAGKFNAILQQALVAILLRNGTRLTLTDDRNSETHFRHEHGNRSLNVTVTATVSFDSSLDQSRLACYKMLGIDVPSNGRLQGKNSKGETEWQLKWVFGEEIAPNNHYGSVPHGDVIRPQDPKLRGTPYTVLDSNGQATLETMTRTERDTPNDGDLHTVVAEVVAKVEQVKKLDPFELIGLAGGAIVIGGMVAQALALPSARLPITVTYHGQDTYVMHSHGSMNVELMALLDFDVDYYSCTGPTGPWKGSAGYAIDSAATGALGTMLGATGPVAGQFTDSTTTFSLAEKSPAPQKVMLGDEGFGLEVTMENPPKRGEHVDGHVGFGTWLMPGSGTSAGDLADTLFDHGMAAGMTFEVRGVPEDPRCPGPRFEENTWDD
ncbi:MAG TPA: hypothetical protein VFS93_07980 [Terrimesophilobacter sp.]|nr:hypothetical protein [Terrimesophilobacter sp.]